jgi:hypothetical protein|tara:strand:+ start:108 stop:215 length:108 start_codon:yes stop_codon:yes gene_type:complete
MICETHQTLDLNVVGEACLAALEQWAWDGSASVLK